MRQVFLSVVFGLAVAKGARSFGPAQQVPDGKKLFTRQCAACHHPTKRYTGWPFQQIRRYYTVAQITTFLHNPVKFLYTDSVMQANRRYSGALMNVAFPDITEQEVKAILDYVDSFPYDPNSEAYAHRRLTLQQKDSIGRVRHAEMERLERERAKMVEDEDN